MASAGTDDGERDAMDVAKMLFYQQLEGVSVACSGALHEVQPRFLPASAHRMPQTAEVFGLTLKGGVTGDGLGCVKQGRLASTV